MATFAIIEAMLLAVQDIFYHERGYIQIDVIELNKTIGIGKLAVQPEVWCSNKRLAVRKR